MSSRGIAELWDGLVAELALVTLLMLFALAVGPRLNTVGVANAAEPPPKALLDFCQNGAGAGECDNPRGVVANPITGHIYVAELGNDRISEFNARGEFVRTWGFGVADGSTAAFQICTASCFQGIGGGGAGAFSRPNGITIDSHGNLYVTDRDNLRVQKFDPEGNFLLMFGGEVNKTKVETGGASEQEENLCPFSPGDECKVGVGGSGKGQFPVGWAARSNIATNSVDTIYVGDLNRVQEFESDGTFKSEHGLPGAGSVESVATDTSGLYLASSGAPGKVSRFGFDWTPRNCSSGPDAGTNLLSVPQPKALATDSVGALYVVSGSSNPEIIKFASSCEELAKFGKGEFSVSTAIATNLCPGSEAPGNLYVANASSSNALVRAYGTEPVGCFKAVTLPADPIAETAATLNGTVNPKGEAVEDCFFRWGETTAYGNVSPCVPNAGAVGTGTEPVAVKVDLNGLGRGTVYHFRLIAEIAGEAEPGSDLTFKTRGPPVISNEHVVGTSDTEASLSGLANPEGLPTDCHFEYTTQAAFEEAGFEGPQSTPAEDVGEGRDDRSVAVTLKGLDPGTAYRWQIVCTNSSDTTEGADRQFATFSLTSTFPSCPNSQFRTGPSAFLPDCRAYEMVSPLDKNGGNILLLSEGNVQATPDGERLTYSAIPTFGEVHNSFTVNQYLASRRERNQSAEGGWSSHGIHPPTVGRQVNSELYPLGLARSFLAFTPDLCGAWLFDYLTPPFTPEGQDSYTNLYRRDNCEPGGGDLEALTSVPLPEGTPQDYTGQNSLHGISDDGRHAVFIAKAALLQDCRTGTAAKSISYQWLRDGVPIENATSPVYAPTAADKGAALQCQVFAITENAGSTQVANPPSVIPPDSGVKVALPVALGSIGAPLVAPPGPLTVGGPGGQTLICNSGSWKDTFAFSYHWYRNGAAIEGATASTYVVSAADVATPAVFQCAVTGTNADGAVTKVSTHRATGPAPSPPAPGGNGTLASASASTGGNMARVYDRLDGELHVVSVLPGGRIADADAGVGSGWSRSIDNAVSADGDRVYWISGPFANNFGEGRIFLRQHPEQGIVPGECAEVIKACTLPVSAGNEAFFWTAATDGSKALYSEGVLSNGTGKLLEFDLDDGGEPKTRQIAEGLEGVAGAGDDMKHIYFVSRKKLTASQQNSEGHEAIEGAPNLYLDEGGALTFIATLAEEDVTSEQPTGNLPYDLVAMELRLRTTRVSADGSRLVFQSLAPLTSYDNTDAVNGKADVEVFAYEAGGELLCISCNPSGARPQGRELRKPFWSTATAGHGIFAAAWISAPEQPLHASNLVSTDGNRIFFNSNDPLLARDTNGTMDVYQWEALGKGGCTTKHPSYFPQNGGCIDLISSGESPFESEFWEASESGDDVFFVTESSLVPKDPGLVDLYDARVGGGFPEPIKEIPCEGEACQSPPPPPVLPTPASRAYSGPGNAGKSRPRCPKGKRKVRKKGKARCVKKKRQANQSRRA